jgi:hypothetical protein
VTRSIGRTYRISRLAVAAAAVLAVGLTSGCGAGHLAETSEVVAAVPGGSTSVPFVTADSPNGSVKVQNATIDFKVGGYAAGSNAPLTMRIINQTNGTITVRPGVAKLQSPTGTAGPNNGATVGTVKWVTPATLAAEAAASAAPSAPASPAPSASASTPGKAPSTNPSAPASPSPSPSATTPPAPADLKIGPSSIAILTSGGEQYLRITKLAFPLTPGDIVVLSFTFTEVGPTGTSAIGQGSVAMPIAPPEEAQPRTTIGG